MDTLLTLLLGLVIVLLITVATGYFVAQEFAYMAVDRSALKARADAGDTGARRALTVTSRTSFMLSGAQLGITVTGLLVGYAAEPLIGQSLSTLLGGISIPLGVSLVIGAIAALTVSTLIQMLFGELFPKNLAIARAEPVAVALATSTRIYLATFGWLIAFFDSSSNLLLRLIRIEPVHDVEHSATARDLEHIVEESRESGSIPEELSALLDRVLDFPTQRVQHAMVPRTQADTVKLTDSVGHVRTLMAEGHSRYPVMANDGEDVMGVVHLIDLLGTDIDNATPVRTVMRPPLLMSTVLSLPEALTTLGESGNRLACVVDEYGGFTGILTREDLAEELVGEITDEHDTPTATHAHEGGSTIMRGDTHVDEAERSLGIDLPRGVYETMAGMVIAQHGNLPSVGETITVALPPDPEDLLHEKQLRMRSMDIEVLEINRHVPSLLRVTMKVAQS